MKVDCPTCGYELETTNGLQCPRCGNSIGCSTLSCADCDACASPLTRVKKSIADRVSLGGTPAPSEE
ncbi:MAG: hypothetical protein ABEJ59_01140 [Halanaeroarchaeum sp.]